MKENTPYSKFGEFFSDFLSQYFKDMTQTEIADELLTRQGFISKIKRGERLPSPEITKRIFDLTGKDIKPEIEEAKKHREQSIRDAMSKKGESAYFDKESETLYINNEATKPRLPIKVVAGHISDYYNGVLEEQCERVPIMRQFPSYDFTCFVRGDSMLPEFKSGDEIACKRVNKNVEWGRVYLLDTNDGAYLKRLYEVDDDEQRICCKSYNSEYKDFYVDKIDIQGIYKIVGLVRFGY